MRDPSAPKNVENRTKKGCNKGDFSAKNGYTQISVITHLFQIKNRHVGFCLLKKLLKTYRKQK